MIPDGSLPRIRIEELLYFFILHTIKIVPLFPCRVGAFVDCIRLVHLHYHP